MASISDIETTLVGMVAGLLYPSGTSAASVSGGPIIVYPGWPSQAQLDSDLVAGKSHVTVFPPPHYRNTTRYPERWDTPQPPVQTLTMSINGQVVTVGGTVATPQNVMVMVSGQPFVYAVQPSDTLPSIASALATILVAGGVTASSTGTSITIAGSIGAARVGASAIMAREVRRQQQRMAVMIWTNNPSTRERIATAIDVGLAPVRFLNTPDGYASRIIYDGMMEQDTDQKAYHLYRRDLLFMIEYPTVQTTQATQVTQVETVVTEAIANTPVIHYS